MTQAEINHQNWINSLNLDVPQCGVLVMEHAMRERKVQARAAMRSFILSHGGGEIGIKDKVPFQAVNSSGTYARKKALEELLSSDVYNNKNDNNNK